MAYGVRPTKRTVCVGVKNTITEHWMSWEMCSYEINPDSVYRLILIASRYGESEELAIIQRNMGCLRKASASSMDHSRSSCCSSRRMDLLSVHFLNDLTTIMSRQCELSLTVRGDHRPYWSTSGADVSVPLPSLKFLFITCKDTVINGLKMTNFVHYTGCYRL